MWLDYFGLVDHLIFYVFCAVAGVVVILAKVNLLVGAVQECCSPTTSRAAAFSIDFFTSTGSILLAGSILIRGLDTDWGDAVDYEKLCQVYPVILLLGLTMFIGGLFVRSWSIFIFYRYNSDIKVRGQEWKPNLWIWMLVLIIAIVSVVWVVEFTPELTRVIGRVSENGDELPVYKCDSGESDDEWKVATSVWHAILLLLAVLAVPINCCAVRGTSGACDFQLLSMVTINTLLSTCAGILVYYAVDLSYSVMYAVEGGLLLWTVLFAQVLFLIGKVCCDSEVPEADSKYDTIQEDGGTMRTYRSSGSFENATFKSGDQSGADFAF